MKCLETSFTGVFTINSAHEYFSISESLIKETESSKELKRLKVKYGEYEKEEMISPTMACQYYTSDETILHLVKPNAKVEQIDFSIQR